MKRFLAVIFALAVLPAGAGAQNSVSAYTTLEEPLAGALFEQFQKETGISVSFIRLSGGETVARMEAEAANPQASIWVGGTGPDSVTAKSKNLTIPYQSRFSRNIRAEFKDPHNYWIGLYVEPLTFVTNLDRANSLGLPPPKSWADLLKPVYKGRIGMANPGISKAAYNVLTTIRTLNNGNEKAAFDYLKKLDVNIDRYAPSDSALGKSVAAGEIPIAIGYAHDQVKLKAEGANVEINAPSEGTGYELVSMSLIRGGKNPLEARRLYDWMLASKNAQKLFTEWYLVLVADRAEKHPLAPSLDQIKTVKQDMDGDETNKNQLLDRWNREIGSAR
ncbi:MAG: ABC transporter substrate-binding protein [Treponema sp.]|jgi:iron(III) transport system substrate-binding protein|nr:ABC transporter substrate-binding protein [Treponema sp.]